MDSVKYCPSSVSTRISVRGEDAATFLQGQFTNDLRRDGANPATYGLWLDNKGKMLADSFVLGKGDGAFEVVSDFSDESVLRERLERYIIADDVEIEVSAGGRRGWIVTGQGAGDWLAGEGLEPPSVERFFESGGVIVLPTRATAQPAWRLMVSEDSLFAEWDERLREHCHGVEVSELVAARIRAGIPAVPVEIGPEDLPNEGGLEHEGISYNKGCYLGQEVMSRLHNLGRVRRRLFVVRWSGAGEVPAVGRAVSFNERKVGELRSFVRNGSGCVGMAMLQSHGLAAGDHLSLETRGAGDLEIVAMAEGKAWS